LMPKIWADFAGMVLPIGPDRSTKKITSVDAYGQNFIQ
jgi:hypothetical protein